MTGSQVSSQLAIERSKALWLEDGNVVLVAEDPLTSKDVGFCVHRGVLARHSPFFKDLFSIPQPENDAEMYDGCPVVRMVDEVAQEVEYILGVLYDGGNSFYNPTITMPFFDVITALKLGTKFSCDIIRDEALRRFSITFPTRRVDFHCCIAPVATFPPSLADEDLLRKRQVAMVGEDAIQAVNVARALNLDNLLPATFYICTQLPIDILLNGVVDGVTGRVHKLSLQDLRLCLKARDEFHQEGIRTISMLLYPTCTQQAQCIGHISKFFRGSAATFLSKRFADHQALLDWNMFCRSLCPHCTAHLYALHKIKIDEVWAGLGERFEVAVWPQSQDSAAVDEESDVADDDATDG